MKKLFLFLFVITILNVQAQKKIETDTFSTAKGNLVIHFIGHGTLMMEFQNKIIHIDPTTREANYDSLPKADLILITHEHGDHLDLSAIEKINTTQTKLIMTQKCTESVEGLSNIEVMANNQNYQLDYLTIESVPAYNLVHKRENGVAYHPKGVGNGYILNIGGLRVYVGGDTENIPEMKTFKNIDIAFLPMNLPYTMTPEMVFSAAQMIKPKVLYPYHYGKTDTNELLTLMKEEKKIEVRIRQMQ